MKPQVYTLFLIYYFIHILMFLFWKFFSYDIFCLKDVFFETAKLSTKENVKNIDCVWVAEVCIV